MDRYEKLRLNFFSCDLKYGKLEWNRFHCCEFFFIVNKPVTDEFLKEQALDLIMSQCKQFVFFGQYANVWHNAVDEADIMIHPNINEEEIALTSTDDTLEDFVESLCIALSCRSIVPYDYYLIYDDKELYRAVLQRIKDRL